MVEGPCWKEVASAAMHRYASGDEASFDELYELLEPRLGCFLLRRVRPRERAEELLQETFLLMIRSRGHFASGASVVPWAYAIARRLMIDELRRNARSSKILVEEQAGAAREAESLEPLADDAFARRRLMKAVQRELAVLPQAQREAFEFVHHEGLTIAETSDVLGTTEMAVRLRLHRAQTAIRGRLGPEFREMFGAAATSRS